MEDRKRGQVGPLPAPASRKSAEEVFGRMTERPEIPEHLELHWEAFKDSLESGPGDRVTTRDVVAFLDLWQVDDLELRVEVHQMARLLGAEFGSILERRAKEGDRIQRIMAARAKALGGKGTRIPRPRARR